MPAIAAGLFIPLDLVDFKYPITSHSCVTNQIETTCAVVSVIMPFCQKSNEKTRGDLLMKQSNAIKQNPIYRLLDMHGGGQMIALYQMEGKAGVERIVRLQVAPFLYANGAGKKMRVADLLADQSSVVSSDDSFSLSDNTITSILSSRSKSLQSEQSNCEAVEHQSNLWRRMRSRLSTWKNKDRLTYYSKDDMIDRLAAAGYYSDTLLEVCWSASKRGFWGETLLHLALMHCTVAHRNIAIVLLNVYPKLAKDIVLGEDYFGENALHLAVTNHDYELVSLLTDCGADLKQRAVGLKFLPNFVQNKYRDDKVKLSYNGCSNQTDEFGSMYFGEYPLSFAACLGHAEIYDFLIAKGADPNLQDSFGNSVLHMVVIHDQTEIYRFALRHRSKQANPNLINVDGLTPVAFSAKLGRRHVFNEIIMLNTVENWRYSNITCTVYPLSALDTIGKDGKTDWNSAMMYIINGKSDDHLDMIEEGVFKQLLEEKWQKFARMAFLQRLALIAMHLLIMSVAIYLRVGYNQQISFSSVRDQYNSVIPDSTNPQWYDIIRWIAEGITVINSFGSLCMQIDEIREQGFFDYIKALRQAPPKGAFFFACIFIVLCVPSRIIFYFVPQQRTQCEFFEETLLIIAVPLAWVYLLFFAGGIELTGPFVTMIYKMLTGDMLRFAVIYIVILVCFAQAYYFLFKDIEQSTITTFLTIEGTLMTLFQMTLGEFKYDEFNYTNYTVLTKIVFLIFMILVPILLLNMLIAMMGNTYTSVISKSRKEWIAMWAKIVIILEQSYSAKRLLMFQNEYSIPVPGKGENERGLMVIHRTKKTMAKQRKTAISNWKRFYRNVIELLREHGNLGNTTSFSFDGSEAVKKTIHQRKAIALKRKMDHKLLRINFENVQSQRKRQSNNVDSQDIQKILQQMELNIFSQANYNEVEKDFAHSQLGISSDKFILDVAEIDNVGKNNLSHTDDVPLGERKKKRNIISDAASISSLISKEEFI